VADGRPAAADAREQVADVVAGVDPIGASGGAEVQDGFRFGGDRVGFVVDLNPAVVADVTDIALGERPP